MKQKGPKWKLRNLGESARTPAMFCLTPAILRVYEPVLHVVGVQLEEGKCKKKKGWWQEKPRILFVL